jgi:regulator of protease activity HflC (stomatin/prohibitin superfamily)
MIQEREVRAAPGGAVLMVNIGLFVLMIILFAVAAANENVAFAVVTALIWAANLVYMIGLFTVAPNEAKVLQLFGRYVGTVREPGLKWANPFYTKRKISVRVRNFESNKLKVNEADGSPIEIAAVVVWRVIDTAEAAFEVDNYENFVHVQSEAALRNLATQHPYDAHDDTTKLSLRGNTADVAEQLKKEVQARLAKAGVQVIEARISHLAYAPEIAAVMLRRQQANAIIAARQRIVEGAVGMVDMALELLQKKNVVTLDEERKAAMVSNLLVVLCGEHDTTPVINTGTIYQ